MAGPEEGLERIQRLLGSRRSDSDGAAREALRACAAAADLAGHDELAEQAAQESLALYTQLGDDESGRDARAHDGGRRLAPRGLGPHARADGTRLALARDRFTYLEITGYWLSGQLALHDGDVEGAVELTRRSAAWRATQAGRGGSRASGTSS